MYKIYSGKVIDNDDPQRLGRAKIKIIPEMDDISDDSVLPWLRPFMNQAFSATSYSHTIPNVGEFVLCIFLDDFYKNGYWITRNFIDGYLNLDDAQVTLSNIEDINIQKYPQPNLVKFDDGTIFFRNSETGEMGISHSSGSYAVINQNGEIILNNESNSISIKDNSIDILNGKLFTIHNEDLSKKIDIDFENGTIEIENDSLDIVTKDITIRGRNLNSEIYKKEETSLTEIKTVSNEYFENIGGTKKEVIGEDKVQTIIGNDKKLIVGYKQLTIGIAQMTITALGNNLTITTNGTINILWWIL